MYSLSWIRLRCCDSKVVLSPWKVFATIFFTLKIPEKKIGFFTILYLRNTVYWVPPILKYMGKENNVLIWVKWSQVINFSVHILLSHIEYIENWMKSVKGDMKNNLLLLLWFSKIFLLNSTFSTLFEPHPWLATSSVCW